MERVISVTGRHWNKTEIKTLKRWCKTESDEQVAERLGRTTIAVRQKRLELNLIKRSHDPLEVIMERQRALLEGK